MEEQFEYLLLVGAGWAQARLTLSGGTALIEYDSASMGQVPVRYIMRCGHEVLSEFHGMLTMTSIEQYTTFQNQFGANVMTGDKETVDLARLIDPDVDEEMLDVMNTLELEYIRLPQPQDRLEEAGGHWGIHDWTGMFSLILMIHNASFWYVENDQFKKTPLARGLDHLDKMHFAVAEGKYSLRS